MFDKYANGDGTFNGASMLADLSGISDAEITWTFNRIKELLKAGKTATEAKAIVKEEAKTRPFDKHTEA